MNAIEERKLLMKEWNSLSIPKVSWERFKRMKQLEKLKQKETNSKKKD
tara:strand:- start:434 stop:577 length:144 start_codon:yes stop_codon:yes gene_type:complete